jgi:hypothetical protein
LTRNWTRERVSDAFTDATSSAESISCRRAFFGFRLIDAIGLRGEVRQDREVQPGNLNLDWRKEIPAVR